jgi:integrase
MSRYKEPFTLYPRKTKDGVTVYYYRTYDEKGRRTNGVSTGKTTERAAKNFCLQLFKEDKLVPKKAVFFEDYTEDFWVWGKCMYILRCNNLNRTKKRISPEHAKTERGYLVNHIRPYFNKKKLTAIQERDIEDFIIHIRRTTKLSSGTINHLIKILKIVFAQALREKLIYENPAKEISYLDADQQKRGVLSLEEVGKLFEPSKIDEIWNGCVVTYAMNVVSASTGMRRGELIGLLNKNVHPTHIHVTNSWGPISGLKHTTKTNESRDVPVTPHLFSLLESIMKGGKQGYTFSYTGGKSHYPENQILPRYYAALEKIGITEQERRERGLTFHSWRHFFNTICLIENIAYSKVQSVTGHKTRKMTENYTHFRIEDFSEISNVQSKIYSGDWPYD